MDEISIIFKRKNRSDNHYHSYLKSYKNGKTKLISLKKKFKCEDVNWGGKNLKEKNTFHKLRLKGEYIKKTTPNSTTINNWFKQVLNNEIEDEIEEKSSFISYIKNHISVLDQTKKYGTRDNYQNFLNTLLLFLKSKNLNDLKFYKIDLNLINDYQNFLINKKLRHTTINNQVLRFKKLYELSTGKYHTPITNVFTRHTFLKSKPIPKDILSIEEVKTLLYSPPLRNPIRGYYFHLDDEGYEVQQPIEISKNIFMFQVFGGGLRISDTLFFQYKDLDFKDDKCILTTRSFKNDSIINIPLNEVHFHILKKCLSSKYQFTKYDNHEEKCPKCNSNNIVSYGKYKLKNNSYGIILKCKDCLRTYRPPKTVQINHIFHDVKDTHFKLTKPKSKPYLPIHIINEFEERNKRISQLEKDKKSVLEILSRPSNHRESYKRIHQNDKRLLYLLDNTEDKLKEIESELNSYDDWLEIWWRKFISEENNHYIKVFKELKNNNPNEFIFNLINQDEFPQLKKDNELHFKTFFTERQYKTYQNKSKRHNSLLKQVQKHFNLETKLTTHTGRHTFTRIGLSNEVSIYSLSRYLSHKSIKTTEKYLKDFDDNLIHNEIEDKIFNKFRY